MFMDKGYNEMVGGVRIVGTGDGEEIQDIVQNMLNPVGIGRGRREKGDLIKKYLGIEDLSECIEVRVQYPATFSKAISLAIEDLLGRADDVEQQERSHDGMPITYTLDEDGEVFKDIIFGGELDIDGFSVRAVIESNMAPQHGLVMLSPEGAATSNYINIQVYVRVEDKGRVSEILDIIDEYVKDNNPLKGCFINIYGSEEFAGELTWDDIAIPEYFKQEIEENIIWPAAYHDKIEAANLKSVRGVMLEGVRGMGKTLLSRIVANYVRGKRTFIKAKPSDIRRLGWDYIFEVAGTLEPSVLYIEDIETLAPSKQMFGMLSTSLTDVLDYLDGTESRGDVIILASTNTPELVDLSMIDRPGRIDRRLVFDPNSREEFGVEWKKKVFEIHLRGHRLEEGLTPEKLSSMIADVVYTGSHIEELIHTAALEALRRSGIDNLTPEEIRKGLVLKEDDFRKARGRVERIIRGIRAPEVS